MRDGKADLPFWHVERVHPPFDIVFELIGVLVGELSGVQSRIFGYATRRMAACRSWRVSEDGGAWR